MRGRDELFERMKLSVKHEKFLILLLKAHPHAHGAYGISTNGGPNSKNSLNTSGSISVPLPTDSLNGSPTNSRVDDVSVYQTRSYLGVSRGTPKPQRKGCCRPGYVYGQVPTIELWVRDAERVAEQRTGIRVA